MSRFVGHLNPETHLLTQSRPSSPNLRQENDSLGIWFSETANTGTKARPKAVASLQRYVNVIRDFEVPDEEVCDALSEIYFSTIHRFIPLIDEDAFRQKRASDDLPIALLLAVLLAACRDNRAKPFLRYPNRSTLLQCREFAQRTYTHLTSLLKADAESDKITLIQVHALMSLHCEGPKGNETSSLNLVTAIHYLQVLGMHLPRADEADRSGTFSKIFWSMWCLDRLNAAYNGRPTIFHEQDMAHKTQFTCPASERRKYAAFLIWLRLTELLDKTIAYYRPVGDPTSTGWELGFPSFEEIIASEDQDMPIQILYVLEIYYHAIAILTSRFREWHPVTASNPASIRQALSTLRMLQIVDETAVSDLPALPIIPYTMTLCLSVTYRQCRAVGTISALNRSKRQLTSAYSVLEEMAYQWWNAEAMAKLGRRAMAIVRDHPHDRAAESNRSGRQPAGGDERLDSFSPGGQVAKHQDRHVQGTANTTSDGEPVPVHPPTTAYLLEAQTHTPPDSAANPIHDVPDHSSHNRASPRNLSHATAKEAPTPPANDYDLFLLDSIPNLVYPESGMTDEFFNDISLYDGFDTGFASH